MWSLVITVVAATTFTTSGAEDVNRTSLEKCQAMAAAKTAELEARTDDEGAPAYVFVDVQCVPHFKPKDGRPMRRQVKPEAKAPQDA